MALHRTLVLLVLGSLAGCALVPRSGQITAINSSYRPQATSTAWPAPAGNLATCGTSGPTGDAPTPRPPADSGVRITSKTVRVALATLCSFNLPAASAEVGRSKNPNP